MRALTDKIRPRHCRTESAEVRSLNYPALVSAPSRGPSIGFLVGGIFMTLEELKRIFPDATKSTWHRHRNGGGWVQNTA